MAEHARFEKLVADAKKSITEISPQDAAAKSQSGEAVIVDVREKDEWDEEHIPDATHLSRGTIDWMRAYLCSRNPIGVNLFGCLHAISRMLVHVQIACCRRGGSHWRMVHLAVISASV